MKIAPNAHTIEAGIARGKYWRQAKFVDVGEPVVYDKKWFNEAGQLKSSPRGSMDNLLMGDFRDATGDDDDNGILNLPAQLRNELLGRAFLDWYGGPEVFAYLVERYGEDPRDLVREMIYLQLDALMRQLQDMDVEPEPEPQVSQMSNWRYFWRLATFRE